MSALAEVRPHVDAEGVLAPEERNVAAERLLEGYRDQLMATPEVMQGVGDAYFNPHTPGGIAFLRDGVLIFSRGLSQYEAKYDHTIGLYGTTRSISLTKSPPGDWFVEDDLQEEVTIAIVKDPDGVQSGSIAYSRYYTDNSAEIHENEARTIQRAEDFLAHFRQGE